MTGEATASAEDTPMVLAESVCKRFGDIEVLRGIDLVVPRGKVFSLIGASGSGKSTFLRCINHLESIDSGRLLVDGSYVGYEERDGKLYELPDRALAARRAEIGMVFQRFNLFPHLTAIENVTRAPVLLKRMGKREAVDVGLQLLERVGLRAKADNYPAELSGGQQQRVAIARALAMRPKLLLFDEPTSALDPELVGEVLAVILDLAKEGRTMIVVTHEISFATEVADVLAFMDGGKILEAGPPAALMSAPTHARTAAFLGNVRKG
jgi:polar amino acid transport system ATP-binding protein